MRDSTKATIMRLILAVCIMTSIGMMYYTYIIEKNYEVITSPTGPEGIPN
jgi:hypothetical protein